MFDRYVDVLEGLERAMLERNEPPSHALAAQQFAKAGIPFKRIVQANPEAILYVADDGKPWTAWSEVKENGKTIVFYRQEGFPAWPSPYLEDK